MWCTRRSDLGAESPRGRGGASTIFAGRTRGGAVGRSGRTRGSRAGGGPIVGRAPLSHRRRARALGGPAKRGPRCAAPRCASSKPGEGGSKEAETFKSDPVRGTLPRPAKAEPRPEPSVARDPETETRSVHREHAGRVFAPKGVGRGGRHPDEGGRQHLRAEGSVVPGGSSGVVEHGTRARGSSRNLRGPAVPTDRWYGRARDNHSAAGRTAGSQSAS